MLSTALPVAAAGAVAVVTTAASVAESAPAVAHEPLAYEVAAGRAVETNQADVDVDLADRRRSAAGARSAALGRAEARARAARAAKREAAERAEKERRSRRWVRAIVDGRQTSGFGPRWGKTHDGLDIGAATGTPLYAMSRGTVVRSFVDPSFGNKVEIQYWDGSVSWYAHMDSRSVQTGDSVMPGDVVGRVGNTGYSFGPHLHIEIQPAPGVDEPLDPRPWLSQRGVAIG